MIFLFAFITTLAYIASLIKLNMVKLKIKNVIVLGICNFISISTLLVFSEPLGVPVILIITILYLNAISKEYMKNTVLVLLTLLIVFIADAISGIVILNIFKITKDQLIDNSKLYIMLHIMVLAMSYIISAFLGDVLSRVKSLKKNSRFIRLLLINLFIGLFMIYIIGNIYKFSQENTYILVLNLILLIAYFSLVTYIAKVCIKMNNDEIKYKYKEQEMERLKEYVDMVETSTLDVRRFKHDYLNILSSINGYIQNRDFEGFIQYFNESVIPQSYDIKHKNISLNNIKNVKISPIKGLLSYKIGRAQALNIEVIVDILDEIETVNMNIVDLCRVIGILLDNAIEESKACENKLIEISIIKGMESNIFVISNTCRDNLPPIYKMMQDGFSTKGESRGLGLSTIQEIIYGEYKNITLNTYIKENVFKQELIIED